MLIVRRELRKEYDVWILCAPCEFRNMIVYILLSLGLISHVNCKGKSLPYELPQIKGFSLSLFRVYWISLHAVRHGKNKSKTVNRGVAFAWISTSSNPSTSREKDINNVKKCLNYLLSFNRFIYPICKWVGQDSIGVCWSVSELMYRVWGF